MADPAQLSSAIADLMAKTTGLTDGGAFNGSVGTTTPAAGTFTFIATSVSPTIVPVGTTRADALQLTAALNICQSAASGTGVILPLASSLPVGSCIIIFNAAANPFQVYASGSETLDAGAGSTGVPLSNTKRCAYYLWGSINWVSAQLGVPSA